MMIDYETNSIHQATVVKRVDNAITWINFNPGWIVIYPVDSPIQCFNSQGQYHKNCAGNSMGSMHFDITAKSVETVFFLLCAGRNRRWNSNYDRW